MEFRNILLILIIIAMLYLVYKYLARGSFKPTGLTSGKQLQVIDPSSIAPSVGGNSSNFAYSIWFYIDNWNDGYGEKKTLFSRGTDAQPCPSVEFTAIQNNLDVNLTCFGDTTTDKTTFTCSVENIPIQRWVNLIVSVYGRSVDIYIDGKLVKTCVMPNVAYVDPNSPVNITPGGGFNGWTSKFKYMPDAINTQEAWNIYQEGYGANVLGNTFGAYSVKVSLLKENNEQSSIQI
jgi:Concanavalin A-like lectin/glucanases superfamily